MRCSRGSRGSLAHVHASSSPRNSSGSSSFEKKKKSKDKSSRHNPQLYPGMPGAGWEPWRKKESGKKQVLPQHMRLSLQKTKQFLIQANHNPKKALGQNFMLDENVLRKVTKAADVQADDVVVEIGPGTGNLTTHLLEAGARVLAIEKDDALVDVVRVRFQQEIQSGQLSVLHADVLHVDVEEAAYAFATGESVSTPDVAERGDAMERTRRPTYQLTRTLPPTGRAKVVANLPYNLTKDVLMRLLPLGGILTDVVVMLQDEAARRWSEASPGDADYRGVSVLARFYADPSYAFFIPRNAFYPAPHVDSACVRFALRDPDAWVGGDNDGDVPRLKRVRALSKLVNAGFTSRRKMLRNTLQGGAFGGAPEVLAALEQAGLDVDARPQDIDAAGFGRLAAALESKQKQAS